MIADVYMHPRLPALVRVFGSDFTQVEHAIAANEEDEIILDAQPHKMYYVVDLRKIQISFDEMVRNADVAAHQFKNYRHQNVIENLMIVPNRPYEMAIYKSSVFGGLPLKTYYGLQDALAHIEQRQRGLSR